MSPIAVSFVLVGSIFWMISWLTVPAPTTGIAAAKTTCDPGVTDALLAESVTDEFDATATPMGTVNVAAKMPKVMSSRLVFAQTPHTPPKYEFT